MEKELGQRIKTLRIAKGMTLKELSKKTDLSISFLSMVERGLTSVAIVSLKKIADALSQNISTFFLENSSDTIAEAYTINRGYSPRIRSINGNYIYYSLAGNNSSFSLAPMYIVLLPGQSRKDVIMFKHPGEEFTYVLEGILSFFIDGKEFLLYPGDSFHGLCNLPHNFVNLSNNNVKVLYVLTPPLLHNEHINAASDVKAEENCIANLPEQENQPLEGPKPRKNSNKKAK